MIVYVPYLNSSYLFPSGGCATLAQPQTSGFLGVFLAPLVVSMVLRGTQSNPKVYDLRVKTDMNKQKKNIQPYIFLNTKIGPINYVYGF